MRARSFPASFWAGLGAELGEEGVCLLCRGHGVRRWLEDGIAGLGNVRRGCDGGPYCRISHCAMDIDGIHPGISWRCSVLATK